MNLKTMRTLGLLFTLLVSLLLTPAFAQSPNANPQGADNEWSTTKYARTYFFSVDDEAFREGRIVVRIQETILPSGEIISSYTGLTVQIDVFSFETFSELWLSGWTSDFEFKFNQGDLNKATVTARDMELVDVMTGEPYSTADIDCIWEALKDLDSSKSQDVTPPGSTIQNRMRYTEATGSIVVKDAEEPFTGNLLPYPARSSYLSYLKTHDLAIPVHDDLGLEDE